MAGTVDAIAVLLEISEDSGTTWKQLICLTSATFNSSRSTDKTETQCGTYTGVGAQTWGFDYDAVVRDDPSTTQLSYKDVLRLHTNGTKVMVRQQYPSTGTAGSTAYHAGSAILTTVQNSTAMQGGKLWAFSGRIEGDGPLDITP